MPVHVWKSAHDLLSESDSGLKIDPNIVTVVPLCPAYAWNLAQSPVSAGAAPPLLLALVVLEPVLLEQPLIAIKVTVVAAAAIHRVFFIAHPSVTTAEERTGSRTRKPRTGALNRALLAGAAVVGRPCWCG